MVYVGLSGGKYGTVTFGRQNAPLFDRFRNVYAPLTVGNYDQDRRLPGALGFRLRQHNSVKHSGESGRLNADAMCSFRGVAGGTGCTG